MASDGFTRSVICLAVFVVVNAAAVVVVAVFQFYNVGSLKAADADLQSNLDDLLQRLEQDGDHIMDMSLALKRSLEAGSRHKRAGLQDIFVEILKAQEAIIERHCQAAQKVCKNGTKGDIGRPGLQGEKGNKGAVGIKGVVGIPGIKGIKGIQGPTGVVGLVGDKGTKGSKGSTGPVGEKGAHGPQGIQGPKGDPGVNGTKGDNGDTGPTGPRGSTGSKGESGTAGVTGNRGLAGVNGSKGEPGPNGRDVDKLQPGCMCLKRPTILGPDSEVRIVAIGGSANLTCAAEGVPSPEVRWVGTASQSVVSILKATLFDYKTYQCTASNMFGTDTKNITVVPGP